MSYKDNTYISGEGVYYKGVFRDVKRSPVVLQPVYEAFTNALESIRIRQRDKQFDGEIEIRIYQTQTTDQTTLFSKLQVSDNGIGFNDEEFKRFSTYKDFTKGFKNLGSGRIQYAHYFDSTKFTSNYVESDSFRKREFLLSKNDEFLNRESIIFHKYDRESENSIYRTTVTFEGLLDDKVMAYHSLSDTELKAKILKRYIQYFCLNKNSLPKIIIKQFLFNDLESTSTISKSDLPSIDDTKEIIVEYSKISDDGKQLVSSDKKEVFTLNSYKLNKSFLNHNELKLTSKDEIVENFDINLEVLAKEDNIDNYHFLFLVSSNYLDDIDTDERGSFNIPSYDEFISGANLFYQDEEIILDLLENQINAGIWELYPQIEEVKKQHHQDLESLKEMFLLSDDLAGELKISINDSSKKILEKYYVAEAKKKAELDSHLKASIDSLDKLDTTSEDYSEELGQQIDELVKSIPQQNKIELTHYIARRKLVLELFTKILGQKLLVQQGDVRNKDEALLHNLMFKQGSEETNSSDLWIINEDFIHFNGVSESKISDVRLNGKNIIRKDLSDAEQDFITSLGENRLGKKPDILLFPQEQKCVILEFKNPDVSVAKHLTQINNYATLLRNFSIPELQLTTFYGYLIGEKIEPNDVRAHDADFKNAHNFAYLFRPSKTVAGIYSNEGKDGSLYTEVIKYSTLLERAKLRNKIFVDKLNLDKDYTDVDSDLPF